MLGANAYAWHLIISRREDEKIVENDQCRVDFPGIIHRNGGDYASGTNHTPPTNGYARVYSGVSGDSFKKITFKSWAKPACRPSPHC
jgi:histidinol dehydrogenase